VGLIQKIISGGQTGADRAGLDVAIEFNIPHGGWVPKGRKTEIGRLPDKYQLREMDTASYPKRTEQNVLDSEGTLIISHGKLNGGSALTRNLAKKHGRPWIHIDMDALSVPDAKKITYAWIHRNNISVLNVAGPRGSKNPKIYDTVTKVLESLLRIDTVS